MEWRHLELIYGTTLVLLKRESCNVLAVIFAVMVVDSDKVSAVVGLGTHTVVGIVLQIWRINLSTLADRPLKLSTNE